MAGRIKQTESRHYGPKWEGPVGIINSVTRRSMLAGLVLAPTLARTQQLPLPAQQTPRVIEPDASSSRLNYIKNKKTDLSFRRSGRIDYNLPKKPGQLNINSVGLLPTRETGTRGIESPCGPHSGKEAWGSGLLYREAVEHDFLSYFGTSDETGRIFYAGWINIVTDAIGVMRGKDCNDFTESSWATLNYTAANVVKNEDDGYAVAIYVHLIGKAYEGLTANYLVRLVDDQDNSLIQSFEMTERQARLWLDLRFYGEEFTATRQIRTEIVVDMRVDGPLGSWAWASGKFAHGLFYENTRECK